MPHLTFGKSKDGYALTVMIGLNGADTTQLMKKGKPVPPPLSVRAILDTGTDITCMATRVLQHFGLVSISDATTLTMGGPVSAKLFEVSLSIPKSSGLTGPLLVLEQLVVMEWGLVDPDIEALIGKDVLSQCLLIIDGPRKEFTLSD
jgi:hypothetical protein